MAWWNATSVTISNNQNVVVVNAADNIGLINDGDALVLAGQIVEIDRAYFDNNNAPRILLKSNWTSGNQTNQPAKAVPIPADLRRAVQYLRDVGQDAITFSEAMAQILSSTAATLIIPTATSGDVTVVPYGRLVQQVNDLLATMGTFGVPLYGTNSKNHARTLMGLQPQLPAAICDLDFINGNYLIYEALGFTRKALVEAITTARSSSASYMSPFGIANAAANLPRITFDPITGENLGLLTGGATTNLLLHSNAMLTSPWVVGAGCVVTEDFDNPVSDDRSYLVTGASVVGFTDPNLRVTVSNIPINTLLAFSVWVYPAANCTSITLRSNSDAQGLSSTSYVRPVTPLRWQRIDAPVARSSASCVITLSSASNNPAGAPFKVSAAQLEVGSVPSPYIKTEASQVTRSADNITINPSKPRQGVIFIEGVAPINTNFNRALSAGNSSTEELGIGFSGATSQTSFTAIIRSGETNTTTGGNNLAPGAKFKFALRYRIVGGGIEWTGFCNGIKNNTLTSANYPAGFLSNPFRIGARRYTDGLFWDGTVAGVKIFAAALSDQELIDLTRI